MGERHWRCPATFSFQTCRVRGGWSAAPRRGPTIEAAGLTVAMFFSEAGARPRTWEASPSEHKKWVEVGVSDFNLIWNSLTLVCLSRVAK